MAYRRATFPELRLGRVSAPYRQSVPGERVSRWHRDGGEHGDFRKEEKERIARVRRSAPDPLADLEPARVA